MLVTGKHSFPGVLTFLQLSQTKARRNGTFREKTQHTLIMSISLTTRQIFYNQLSGHGEHH